MFRISPSGRIDQILGPEGDGNSPLEYPFCLVTGPDGMVYACGLLSNNIFAISPDGDIRELIDESGDGKTNFYTPDIHVDRFGEQACRGRRRHIVPTRR